MTNIERLKEEIKETTREVSKAMVEFGELKSRFYHKETRAKIRPGMVINVTDTEVLEALKKQGERIMIGRTAHYEASQIIHFANKKLWDTLFEKYPEIKGYKVKADWEAKTISIGELEEDET